MNVIIERLKVKRQPNQTMKDGLALKIPIVDQRANIAVNREVILERLNRTGKVERFPKDDVRSPEENLLTSKDVVRRSLTDTTETETEESVPAPDQERREGVVGELRSEAQRSEVSVGFPTKKIGKMRLEEGAPAEGALPKAAATKKVTRKQKPRLVVEAPSQFHLPKPSETLTIRVSPHYLENRSAFLKTVRDMFQPYVTELESMQAEMTCGDLQSTGKSEQFQLLLHQRVVRDYLNLYTPYRGLLLYMGLGSGKTATSIAIAEGMKSRKKIFVLTPASLKMNYLSELKKYGDPLFKKNQYWEFVSTDGQPDLAGELQRTLHLPTDYLDKKRGAWMVNATLDPNFADLSAADQAAVDEQLNLMIRDKYTNINYNGLTRRIVETMSEGFKRNPFDNSVVVIDEAHNFVSRIVNQLPKAPKKKATTAAAAEPDKMLLNLVLYEYLMSAQNARIVLLSGTPIINYPNEIAVMYNILRGYIKTWTMNVQVTTTEKVNTAQIIQMLTKNGLSTFDYVEYSSNKLTITRNPLGFVNNTTGTCNNLPRKGGTKNNTRRMKNATNRKTRRVQSQPDDDGDEDEVHGGAPDDEYDPQYKGVCLDGWEGPGYMTDAVFIKRVKDILQREGVNVVGAVSSKSYKCLPDQTDEFLSMFVQNGTMTNVDLFARRILGLTSYFRSAQENLLPSFEPADSGAPYHMVRCEMSDYQFGIYERIRNDENTKEKNTKKMERIKKNKEGELFESLSSTYRIFSRAACNWAWPDPPGRPVTAKKGVAEAEGVAEGVEDEGNVVEGGAEMDVLDDAENPIEKDSIMEGGDGDQDQEEDLDEPVEPVADMNVAEALARINSPEYLSPDALTTYSPKFTAILDRIQDETATGLHLLYSNFRTMEGIGILRLVLLQNGFAEFKLVRGEGNRLDLEDTAPADTGKPRFVLYTGTESTEEKEIIRNIYNGSWELVPSNISAKLEAMDTLGRKNTYGDIIRVLMITASGAEGINLKNTRYVHIVEPYWNMVRVEQVVGRARRICSHEDLPPELRTVKVYVYLSVMSEAQQHDKKYIELINRDVSKLDNVTPVTTDEFLYEIAQRKEVINRQILHVMKESAIDCTLHSKKSGENVVCYGTGRSTTNDFLSYPTLAQDAEIRPEMRTKKVETEYKVVTIQGVRYQMNVATQELYDAKEFTRAKAAGEVPVSVGLLVREGKGYRIKTV